MKKTLLIVAVILISTSAAFSQVKFGAGLTAGSKAKFNDSFENQINLGLNARVLANISDNFAFTGGVSYFLPYTNTIAAEEIKRCNITFNADAVYYFTTDESAKIYGLGGLNFAAVKVKNKTADISDSIVEISWEAGVGVLLNNIFIEAKYDHNFRQVVGTVGIYF